MAGHLLAIPILATYIILCLFVDPFVETLEPVLDKASDPKSAVHGKRGDLVGGAIFKTK